MCIYMVYPNICTCDTLTRRAQGFQLFPSVWAVKHLPDALGGTEADTDH